VDAHEERQLNSGKAGKCKKDRSKEDKVFDEGSVNVLEQEDAECRHNRGKEKKNGSV